MIYFTPPTNSDEVQTYLNLKETYVILKQYYSSKTFQSLYLDYSDLTFMACVTLIGIALSGPSVQERILNSHRELLEGGCGEQTKLSDERGYDTEGCNHKGATEENTRAVFPSCLSAGEYRYSN